MYPALSDARAAAGRGPDLALQKLRRMQEIDKEVTFILSTPLLFFISIRVPV
jgi:hypothetical protein